MRTWHNSCWTRRLCIGSFHSPLSRCNGKLKTDEIKQKYRERVEKRAPFSKICTSPSRQTITHNCADDTKFIQKTLRIMAIITANATAAVATGEKRHRGQWVRKAAKKMKLFFPVLFSFVSSRFMHISLPKTWKPTTMHVHIYMHAFLFECKVKSQTRKKCALRSMPENRKRFVLTFHAGELMRRENAISIVGCARASVSVWISHQFFRFFFF